jgi:hypothetical protein
MPPDERESWLRYLDAGRRAPDIKTGFQPVMENALPACFPAAVRFLNCANQQLEARSP